MFSLEWKKLAFPAPFSQRLKLLPRLFIQVCHHGVVGHDSVVQEVQARQVLALGDHVHAAEVDHIDLTMNKHAI